jgi:hypothetical protein
VGGDFEAASSAGGSTFDDDLHDARDCDDVVLEEVGRPVALPSMCAHRMHKEGGAAFQGVGRQTESVDY